MLIHDNFREYIPFASSFLEERKGLIYNPTTSEGIKEGPITIRDKKMFFKGNLTNNLPDGKGIIFIRRDTWSIAIKGIWSAGSLNPIAKIYVFDLNFYNTDSSIFENLDLSKSLRKQLPGTILYRGCYSDSVKTGTHIIYHKNGKHSKKYVK